MSIGSSVNSGKSYPWSKTNTQTTTTRNAKTASNTTTTTATAAATPPPVITPGSGVAHPNGLTEVATYSAQGKSLIHLTTPGGKDVYFAGPATGLQNVDPIALPAAIVAGIDNHPGSAPFIVDRFDTPENPYGNGTASTLVNFLIPGSIDLNQANSHFMVVQNHPNDTNPNDFFSYDYQPNQGYRYRNGAGNSAAPIIGGTVPGTVGRRYIYQVNNGGTIQFGTGQQSQFFYDQTAAQTFAQANNGTVKPGVVETHPTPVMPDDFTNTFQPNGWSISNILTSWVATNLNNILEGSTEYNQYINNPEYQWVQTGIRQVLVSSGTDEQTWNGLSAAAKDALVAQHGEPPLIVTSNQVQIGTNTVTYNNGETLAKDSAQYLDLVNNGWTPKYSHTVQGTATTVTLGELTPEQIANYQADPTTYKNFRIIDYREENHPGDTTTYTKYYNNPVVGTLIAGMNADDDGVLTGAELSAIYNDPKYCIDDIHTKGTLADGVTAVTDHENCDFDDTYVAGDPYSGGMDTAYAATEFMPGTQKAYVMAKNESEGNFSFQLNGQASEINDHQPVGVAFTQYNHMLETSDGSKTNILFDDGLIYVTENAGTANETVVTLDAAAGDLPYAVYDPAFPNAPVYELTVNAANGAGKDGATEQRVYAKMVSLPEQAIIDDLVSKGIPLDKIYSEAGTVEMSIGVRAVTEEGGDAYGKSLGGAAVKGQLADGILDTWYDIHILEDECVEHTYTVTTDPTCDKFPIYGYDECDEIEMYEFCKDEPVYETQYDVTLPATDAVYEDVPEGKFLKKEIEYEISRTEYEVCYGEDFDVNCFTAGSISPLALDLNGNGVTTTNNVWQNFDLDGSGQAKNWNASLDLGDGWLVWDKNADGVMNNGTELFGNVTGGGSYPDGLAALRDFAEQGLVNSTADGVLSLVELQTLEANSNLRIQVTDPQGNPQLVAPTSLGITEINVYADPNRQPFVDANNVVHNPRTSFTRDGQEFDMNDLWMYQVSGGTAAATDTVANKAADVAKKSDDTVKTTTVSDKKSDAVSTDALRNNDVIGNRTTTSEPVKQSAATHVKQPDAVDDAGQANAANQQSAANSSQAAINAAVRQAMSQLFAQPQEAQNTAPQYNPVDMLGYMGQQAAFNPMMGMMQQPASFQQQMNVMFQMMYMMTMLQSMMGTGFNPFMMGMPLPGRQPEGSQ